MRVLPDLKLKLIRDAVKANKPNTLANNVSEFNADRILNDVSR